MKILINCTLILGITNIFQCLLNLKLLNLKLILFYTKIKIYTLYRKPHFEANFEC